MPVNLNSTKIDDLLSKHFAEFDTLLTTVNKDHNRIMTEASKLIILLAHYGMKADHENIMDHHEEMWVRVHEVKGTYNSKTVLILTIVSASLTILSGLVGLASIVPGTSLGTTLVNKGFTFLKGGLETGKQIKTGADAVGQFANAAGMFPNIAEKANESKRVVLNAHKDEEQQKTQDRKDSKQRNRQLQERTLQQNRENDQKKSQVLTEMMRS
jgi:hypothetical protein